MFEKIQIDCNLVVIEATVKEDSVAVNVSTASLKQIKVKDPAGTVITLDAAFKTDGTDGVLQATLLSSHLEFAGDYYVQTVVTIGSGTWYSHPVFAFRAYENL